MWPGRCGVDHKTVGGVRKRLEAVGEIPQYDARSTPNGRRYPVGPQAGRDHLQRLAGQGGVPAPGRTRGRAPDETLNVRDLRTLSTSRTGTSCWPRPSRPVKLGDDFKIHACDFRKLGDRIGPGDVSPCADRPPLGGEARPELAQAAVSLLKPDGILACFTGVYYLPYFIGHFQEAGLRYEWTVAEVHRFRAIRNAGQVKIQWSPIVVFRKEPRGRLILNQVLEDVFRFEDLDKSLHPWQQSQETSVALVRSLSRPGDLVCDLFVGSGTIAAAVALAGEGRRFAGCEIDARLVKAARARVSDALAGRQHETELELATV